MQEQEIKAIDLRTYVKALWRRRWLLIIPIVAAGIVGYVSGKLLPPVYEAKSTVVVRVQERLSEPLARLVGRSPLEDQLSRLQEKVKSRTFLIELVRSLDMTDDPSVREWAESMHEKNPSMTVQQLAETRAVEYLQNRIAIVRTSSNGFQVVARDYDPDRAMLLAQHITNAFVSASNREQIEEIRAVHDFSVEQLVIYRQKLEEAEQRLQEFQETQTPGGLVENPVTSENVNKVDILISQAMVDRDRAAERRTERRTALFNLASEQYDRLSTLTSETMDALFEELVALEREIATVLVRASDNAPEATTLFVRSAENKDRVRAEARSLAREEFPDLSQQVYDAFAELKIAEVEEMMATERRRILGRFMWDYAQGRANAPEREMEYQRLVQEVESNRALYEAFLEQSAAGQITEALEAARAGGRFEIIEPPTRPTSPVAPDRLMILALSLLGGFVVGTASVFVTEQADTSFKDIDDIERTLGLPTLATVPEADIFKAIGSDEKRRRRQKGQQALEGRSRLVRYMMRETPVSFEFRRLARKLGHRRGGETPKSILITSAHRGEGKTTAAACLAITLAKHHQRRTVLVDADLRKPRVHQLMDVARDPGLADALERGHLLGSDLKSTALENLYVLPCGTRREQPTWLLESMPGSRVLEELLSSFDHVIIDTAPNVPVPDAILMGSSVDAVVMVVRAGITPREVVARGLELQLEENANVLGLVVNNLARVLPYYYDYKYYRYEGQGPPEEEQPKG
ncbi:MAG: polysaccharide biosynthesis tyrosine autokinase [Candidatus Eisenbacteria bacterium]|nr:polysaccharide biosynthesis tyrosine autokinase [Candidatus Eisenbacteria bacterium]